MNYRYSVQRRAVRVITHALILSVMVCVLYLSGAATEVQAARHLPLYRITIIGDPGCDPQTPAGDPETPTGAPGTSANDQGQNPASITWRLLKSQIESGT